MWMSGRMLGIWARQMLVGLVFGQADEDVLELDDAAGDGSGIELVAVGDQISLLSLGQGVGVQEPAWRSAGSVVRRLRLPTLSAPHPTGLASGSLGEHNLTLTCSQKRPRTSHSSLVS